MEDLASKYYDTKSHSSFSGVNRLVKHTKKGKKEVGKWLSLQDTYTLHRPVRKKFKRRRVITGSIGYHYQIDIVDLSKYVSGIQVFGIFLWLLIVSVNLGLLNP